MQKNRVMTPGLPAIFQVGFTTRHCALETFRLQAVSWNVFTNVGLLMKKDSLSGDIGKGCIESVENVCVTMLGQLAGCQNMNWKQLKDK